MRTNAPELTEIDNSQSPAASMGEALPMGATPLALPIDAETRVAPDYTRLLRNYISQLTGHRHNGLF